MTLNEMRLNVSIKPSSQHGDQSLVLIHPGGGGGGAVRDPALVPRPAWILVFVAACWSRAAASCLDLTPVLGERRPQPLTNRPHSPRRKKNMSPLPVSSLWGGGGLCQ